MDSTTLDNAMTVFITIVGQVALLIIPLSIGMIIVRMLLRMITRGRL